jgi:hypothetical protein
MSKPVLLSGGNGKVQELVGSTDKDLLTWDAATSEWKALANTGGSVTMGGDISGASGNATVTKIQNIPVSTTDPVTGKILQYDGTSWVPADVPQGGSGGGGVMYYFNKGTARSGGNLPANTYQLGRTAETAQSSVALTNLATASWTRVGGFVTDASDPSVTTVPAGLWDFNFWANTTAAANNQAYVRFTLYAYDGSTNPEAGTALAQTDNIFLYDANVIAQYIAAMLINAGTTLPSTSTRLYLLIEARASTSNRDLTVYFGNSTPTHTHSTIPSVGGTGLVHVIDGVTQSPASAVNLASSDVTGTLPVANGGTNTATAAANTVFAGPTSGADAAPSFRTLGVAEVTGAAPLASPTFTGTPLSTTAAADTNTTQIATTAYVVGQASSSSPVMDGSATIGTSLKYARADHVHPSDTSRAPLASPTFTGTPSLPTGTTGVTQSAGNNTTALATTAFVTTAVATSSGAPYDLPCEIPGTPDTSKRVVNFEAVRPFILAATGHQGGQVTAPSGNFICTVKKNATTVGTITFGTSSFSTSITATSFAAGDVLSVETPASDLGIDTPFFTMLMTLA